MAKNGWAKVLDGGKVRIDRYRADDTQGLEKEDTLPLIEKLGQEFEELANLLAYAGRHALLIVLQGRDASGKDGTIRKILDYSNVQNANVHPFKVPTEEERGHDFLWRAHKAAPGRGHIAIWNRSHYEDVIAARVHRLVPEATWKARYEHINAFERLLEDNGTIVLKFYLHISRDEQIERLLEREQAPQTAWKLNPGDWKELERWDDVTQAYDDLLTKCASKRRPWYLVPADKKWFRNLAVLERIVMALRPYRKEWLAHLEAVGREAKKEIDAIRARAHVPKRKRG